MQKVVIIEDSEVVARLYENKLKAAGNTVHVALDGAHGLELIHSVKPDLVLLDLMLPKMSGTEIIKKVREDHRFSQLPIMAYSSADESVLAEAVEAGSTTIISKNEASFKEIFAHFNDLLEASRHWQIYDPNNFYEKNNGNKESASPKTDRVLIVEDDLIPAIILSDLVKRADLNPVVFHDGQEAYQYLTAHDNFAAAIFDVELPKMRGTDLLKYMRSEKRLCSIPVTIITASSEYDRFQLGSQNSGATFFISKPFERGTLGTILKTLVQN